MRHRHLVTLLVLLLCGCTDQGTPPDFTDMNQRWQAHNLHDYTIDQQRVCFCPFASESMRIIVRSDTIQSVTRSSDGTILPKEPAAYYLTIDALFDLIQYSTAESLVVTYNDRYGYPEILDIDPQLHSVDGGVLYTTSNLRIP